MLSVILGGGQPVVPALLGHLCVLDSPDALLSLLLAHVLLIVTGSAHYWSVCLNMSYSVRISLCDLWLYPEIYSVMVIMVTILDFYVVLCESNVIQDFVSLFFPHEGAMCR